MQSIKTFMTLQAVGSLFVMLTVFVPLSGCSKRSGKADVSGVITLDGKPISNGTIRFIPAEGQAVSGEVKSDGSFSLSADGKTSLATVGLNQIEVLAFESEVIKRDSGGRPDPSFHGPTPKSLIPPRYQSAATSGLTYQIQSGQNTAEIKLTTTQ